MAKSDEDGDFADLRRAGSVPTAHSNTVCLGRIMEMTSSWVQKDTAKALLAWELERYDVLTPKKETKRVLHGLCGAVYGGGEGLL